MEKILYLSLGLNLILLAIIWLQKKKAATPAKDEKTAVPPTSSEKAVENAPRPPFNEPLKRIADDCEAKLPEEERGKVKLLIEKDNNRLAALQICGLRISLCREAKFQSLFDTDNLLEALELACNGYDGTGRYIPVPAEVKIVLNHRKTINVYLKALGLEQIPENEEFCCLDVETGWNTGWKRFDWDPQEAFCRLRKKFRTFSEREGLRVHKGQRTKLFLLLKGWEHLFTEI